MCVDGMLERHFAAIYRLSDDLQACTYTTDIIKCNLINQYSQTLQQKIYNLFYSLGIFSIRRENELFY